MGHSVDAHRLGHLLLPRAGPVSCHAGNPDTAASQSNRPGLGLSRDSLSIARGIQVCPHPGPDGGAGRADTGPGRAAGKAHPRLCHDDAVSPGPADLALQPRLSDDEELVGHLARQQCHHRLWRRVCLYEGRATANHLWKYKQCNLEHHSTDKRTTEVQGAARQEESRSEVLSDTRRRQTHGRYRTSGEKSVDGGRPCLDDFFYTSIILHSLALDRRQVDKEQSWIRKGLKMRPAGMSSSRRLLTIIDPLLSNRGQIARFPCLKILV